MRIAARATYGGGLGCRGMERREGWLEDTVGRVGSEGERSATPLQVPRDKSVRAYGLSPRGEQGRHEL